MSTKQKEGNENYLLFFRILRSENYTKVNRYLSAILTEIRRKL